MLNLQWLKIPEFVNSNGRNCTKKSELKTWGGFLVIINIRPVFQIHYCLIRELQIMVSRAYTTFYLPMLQLSYIFLEIEVYNARPTTKGRDACLNFILQKVHAVPFFLLFFRRGTIISD